MSRYVLTNKHAGLYYSKPLIVDTETNKVYVITDTLPDGRPVVELLEELTQSEETKETTPAA
ncbi:hypothetical protein ES703_37279 [subsurface metagenome]